MVVYKDNHLIKIIMENTGLDVRFKGNPITILGNKSKKGEKASDFVVLDTNASPKKLSDFKNKIKILSVFPSVDTSVCDAQNKRFNEIAASLDDDVVILGISNDLPPALKRYCGAEDIDKVITLSDHKDLDFASKYGFLIEELRLLTRGIVIIDKNDIIRYVEYVPDVSEEPDYDKALGALKEMTS